IDRRRSFASEGIAHSSVVEGGVKGTTTSDLRCRSDRIGVISYNPTLLGSTTSYRIAVEHTINALTTWSISIQSAYLAFAIQLEQVVFTKHFTSNAALHCSLLALADNHPTYALRIVQASKNGLFDQPLAAALRTEDRL